jgi:hypothetical protein
MLPVLRGFSRSAKQDSEASAASVGMATDTDFAPAILAAVRKPEKNILEMLPWQQTSRKKCGIVIGAKAMIG